MRSRLPLAALALGAVPALAAALTGAGCPARDLEVQITPDGADALVVACESSRSACGPLACHQNHLLCTQDTCKIRNVCQVDGNPDWAPENGMGMRLLLIQLGATTAEVKTASPCVPINLRPCIRDPTGTIGCPCIEDPLGTETCNADPNGQAQLACIRDTLAQGVDSALGSGLSFSGFTSTDNVVLVAAFFAKPGGEPGPCDAGILVNPSDCTPGQLTAVAGLAAPVGTTTYDITCASCQGGTHGAFGPDNAPCPATTDACFLQRVEAALVASGM